MTLRNCYTTTDNVKSIFQSWNDILRWITCKKITRLWKYSFTQSPRSIQIIRLNTCFSCISQSTFLYIFFGFFLSTCILIHHTLMPHHIAMCHIVFHMPQLCSFWLHYLKALLTTYQMTRCKIRNKDCKKRILSRHILFKCIKQWKINIIMEEKVASNCHTKVIQFVILMLFFFFSQQL
jgi:hypothetical protein